MTSECEIPKGKTVDFLKELAALLEKYNIEITASDEWTGYAECGEDIEIRIEPDYPYTDWFSIPFGTSLSKEDIKKVIEKAGS